MSCYISNLIKSENPAEYAKKANSGMMLAYPIKINGQHHRPDTHTSYHASIKVFEPKKDHAHKIHELAQHLPLNPPDAANTQIEPTMFKDRSGNDVYVLKLSGNSAEKIKEHHAKFSHMGNPESYEYQAHVSVPKSVHDQIKSSGMKTAKEAGIQFGPAELKRGPKTLKTYHHKPDSSEPLVPDESDFTAKINAPKVQIKKSEEDDKNILGMKDESSVSSDEDAHALLNREENKYFLPRKNLERVISVISDRLALGDIDTDARYNTNRTIYLDNKDLTAFQNCIAKKTPRLKVRIRQYCPNSDKWENVAYAEFKMKESDGYTKKIRVRIPASHIDSISNGGQIELNEDLVNINKDIDRRMLEARVAAINNSISREGLRKQVEVRYERRAYTGKNIRITIDDNLRFEDTTTIDPIVKDAVESSDGWKKFLRPYIQAKWENPLIMEIKTEGKISGWVEALLEECRATKEHFSKYCAGTIAHLRTGKTNGEILNLFENLESPLEDVKKSENVLEKRENVDIAVVVLRDGNFVLVGKRRKNKKWGLPGGRNEGKGEDNKNTALRELEEETGLKLKLDDLTLAGVRKIKNDHENKHVYVYTAKYPGGQPTTKEDPDREFTRWSWMRCEDGHLPDEILDNKMSPPTEAAFDELDMIKDEEGDEELKPLMKPYVSEAQRRWAHTPSGKEALGGNAGVHEWDEATKGKKLPERVSKANELEKGALKTAGMALGMAGALAGASPQAIPANRAPASIQQPKQVSPSYDHKKMLNAISQVESSGGKNINHALTSQGQAYGRYALMPNTIHDTIKGHKDLKAKYGKALTLNGPQLHRFMQDNKGLEDIIADRHLAHIEHNFKNNPDAIGFSWNQGITGAKNAKNKGINISNHPYTKKIREAYSKEK